MWNIAGDDLLLAAVYGGVILGIGIGMVFLGQGTTGGTDMMAALIQKYMRHYSIAQIMQFIDGLIVIVCQHLFSKVFYFFGFSVILSRLSLVRHPLHGGVFCMHLPWKPVL